MSNLIRDTVSMLAATPARWSALAAIEPALLERSPAPGEWSALACLSHVVDTEGPVFLVRLHAVLEGRGFAAFDPDIQGSRVSRSMRDLADEFATRRAASLAALAALTESDLERTGRHAELGPVSMRELLSEWAAHDTMHVVQAERALMQAFIPGSGPWRSGFADHDVEAGREVEQHAVAGPMFKAIILLTRKDGMTRSDFRDWMLVRHAPLAKQLPGLRKLVFNIVDNEDAAYDGVSELWFDSRAAFDAAYATEIGGQVAGDSLANVKARIRLYGDEQPQLG